ncbi:MAG: class I SAM-dependent methyltransferase [Acidimicrobiales bacterium]
MVDVVRHYRSDGLTSRILDALAEAGYSTESIDADTLAGVDEFHLGGRSATDEIIEILAGTDPGTVLDVGCGIGGSARTIASRLGCQVVGIDLTPEFIETAVELTRLVGLDDRARFRVGSATELGLEDGSVDSLAMVHVGMNIDDKNALAAEFARVLTPGGTAVIYDIMRMGDGDLEFPLPWAASPSSSFVATPQAYVEALHWAGFEVQPPADKTSQVLSVISSAAEQPAPPVNLGHLMGSGFPSMFANLMGSVRSSDVAPMLLVARAPAADVG